MKVIQLSGKAIYYTLYGLLLSLNYAVEGFLIYGTYWLINHWWTTGEEMFFWIVGAGFLLIIRCGMTFADEPWDDAKRFKIFSFHWYILKRTLLTLFYFITKIPLRFEIKDDE